VLADYLTSSWVGRIDFSKVQDRTADRETLVRRIAELEALFESSLQRETALSNKVENVRELLECSICYGSLCWPVSLRCSHTFCSACVAKWEISAASSGKQLTCPTCRALAGPPTPARALNEVCKALEDEETAARRKEDADVHQKYEASLRARARQEVHARITADESIPLTFRPEAQAVHSAVGPSRPPTATAVNAQSDFVVTMAGRLSRTPSPPVVSMHVDGADATFDMPASAPVRLQAPTFNAAAAQAEDQFRVHTPSSRVQRTTRSSFLETERS